MITSGSNNVNRGQYEEVLYQLFGDISFQFQDHYIYLLDNQGNQSVRFILDQGLLKASVFYNGSWTPWVTITSPDVIPENDSPQLPHNPSSTNLSMVNNQMQVILQNIQRMLLTSSKLTINVQDIQISNNSGDVQLFFDALLGQKLLIKDPCPSGNLNILSVSKNNINVYNKPILGVMASTDPTSAVTLLQLQEGQSRFLKMGGLTNDVQILNSQLIPQITIQNTVFLSQIPLRYQTRPITFQLNDLPDLQKINELLSQYQLMDMKDQANGYAGLDNTGRIDTTIQSLSGVELNGGILTTFGNQVISTDNLQEGITNKYFTDTRALNTITTQKGISNGIVPLDANAKIPSQFLTAIPTGTTFSGLDVNKTNPLQYPVQTPITGDQYIATDTSNVYILNAQPYNFLSNWTQLVSQIGVQSVNGFTGIVSLSSDDIPEGSSNQYFANGMTQYLTSTAGQANQLLKLDNSAFIPSSKLNNILLLNNGSVQIQDNQFNQITFQNSANNDPLLAVNTGQIVAYKPIRYTGNPTPVLNNDIPNKLYVDSVVSANVPTQIANNQSRVQTTPTQVTIEAEGSQLLVGQQTQITSQVPIVYEQNVSVIQDQQLATKEYVDSILSSFINGSGASKEYLQATSNDIINTNSKITGWEVNIQSPTSNVISFNIDDTFTLAAGVYRFYIGVQISDFVNADPVNISVVIKDTTTCAEYFYFEFNNQYITQGTNQTLTFAYPYIWTFASSTTIEVFVKNNNIQTGIYESYIMIEQFSQSETSIGQDRITDPALKSKLQITDQYLDFRINEVQYGQMSNNQLLLEPSIKIKYAANTTNTDANQLVTKNYVDQALILSTQSITDLGQLIQVKLSTNQSTGLGVGGYVNFDTVVVSTSLTTTVSNGVFTFLPGFVYRVFYTVSARFSTTSGFCILAMKDLGTQTISQGSYLYLLMTSSSNDTQLATATFYLDLRNEVVNHTYKLVIVAAQNVSQIYSQYSSFSSEQVQQIQEQLFDRIQNLDISSQLMLANQRLSTKLNNQIIELTSNISGSIERALQVPNASELFTSTADSTQTTLNISLPNPDNTSTRDSTVSSSVNGQVTAKLTAKISDNISLNLKSVEIGGDSADKLTLFTENSTVPQIEMYSIASGQNIPIQCMQKIGVDPVVTITEPQQLTTKAYVDRNSGLPIGGICIWPTSTPPTNHLICDGSVFSQIQYPDLYTVLGSTSLPDYRGYFLRGLESSSFPLVETQANRTIGSVQFDSLKSHNHTVQIENFLDLLGPTRGLPTGTSNGTSSVYQSSFAGGAETRPKNIAINYIIRAI